MATYPDPMDDPPTETQPQLLAPHDSPYTTNLFFAFLNLINSPTILSDPPGNTNTTTDPSFKYYLPESDDYLAVVPTRPIQFRKYYWFPSQEHGYVDFNMRQFEEMGGIRVMIQTSSRAAEQPEVVDGVSSIRLNNEGRRGSLLTRAPKRKYTIRVEVWMTKQATFWELDPFSLEPVPEPDFPYPNEIDLWLSWVADPAQMTRHGNWGFVVDMFRKAAALYRADEDIYEDRVIKHEELGNIDVEFEVRPTENNHYASI
ncbi:hypothetical protein GLAREA_12395 [Glarea lozoyensis ATCC 20868]|uniref:Uncharacterized protein n=1 Tax=Glarea lozoyensis (strain ATCC 20868 / MF5171) TaxID=1116229 RepID=S3D3A0_GLAL2|nr:uncharacterized protein GLAREA_12395 [Glarea lozoyensis ATCC 20868]EPE31639.1 hypothetical protein GLAREA_12395 [Glarea lozoyensis ATCC 20868]